MDDFQRTVLSTSTKYVLNLEECLRKPMSEKEKGRFRVKKFNLDKRQATPQPCFRAAVPQNVSPGINFRITRQFKSPNIKSSTKRIQVDETEISKRQRLRSEKSVG